MVSWYRIFLIFVSAFFSKKILPTDTSYLSFRVWPQEADKRYMNNASFWTITEMGQMYFLFRTGLFTICRRYHWTPLVGSQKMIYKKPLKRFERFQLKSKIIFYDDKWLYFEQIFLKNRQLVANSLVKMIFKGRDGNIPVPQILTFLGIEVNLPHEELIGYSEIIDNMLLESEGP